MSNRSKPTTSRNLPGPQNTLEKIMKTKLLLAALVAALIAPAQGQIVKNLAYPWGEVDGNAWIEAQKAERAKEGQRRPNRKIKRKRIPQEDIPRLIAEGRLDWLGPRGTLIAPKECLVLKKPLILPQGTFFYDPHDQTQRARPTIRLHPDFPAGEMAVQWVRASRGQGNTGEGAANVWISTDTHGKGGFAHRADQGGLLYRCRVTDIGPGDVGFWAVSCSHTCYWDGCEVKAHVPKGQSDPVTGVKIPPKNSVGYLIGRSHTNSNQLYLRNCYSHNTHYGIKVEGASHITDVGTTMEDVILPYFTQNCRRRITYECHFDQSCGRGGLIGTYGNVGRIDFSGSIRDALFENARIEIEGVPHQLTTSANKFGNLDFSNR